MGIIYKITSPSGKSYIGKTNGTLKRRLRVHMSSGSKCPAIKAAIEKYGEDAMSIDILAEVPDPLSNEWEMFMIKKHGTYGPGGYNLTPGGGDPPLKCPEVAMRMRETMARPEVKAKLSEAQRRNHAKKGAKEKRSKALKKAHSNPKTAARYHAGWKIGQNRPEVKEKQRIAQTEAHKNPQIHEARMTGLVACRKDPAKEKARIEAIRAAHKRDPTINKRRSETLKATLAAKKA